MSILGRIGNQIGTGLRRLPGGNAMAGALGKSPVLGRLPGVRPPSPAQSPIGPSPNSQFMQNFGANALGAIGGMARPPAGGDMAPQRGPEIPMGPYQPMEGPQNTGAVGPMSMPFQPMEGPQNTGINGGMPPLQPDLAAAGPMIQNPMMQNPKPMMGPQEPSGGMGPNPQALQEMVAKKAQMQQQTKSMMPKYR